VLAAEGTGGGGGGGERRSSFVVVIVRSGGWDCGGVMQFCAGIRMDLASRPALGSPADIPGKLLPISLDCKLGITHSRPFETICKVFHFRKTDSENQNISASYPFHLALPRSHPQLRTHFPSRYNLARPPTLPVARDAVTSAAHEKERPTQPTAESRILTCSS